MQHVIRIREEKNYMKALVIFIFSCINLLKPDHTPDQIPDFLIIGSDTILLKSFPLEELGFKVRPFQYELYDFPDNHCYRGYQAVWKVVGNKLYLAELLKADGSGDRIDIVAYFVQNDYIPIVRNGLIYADWFSMDLRSHPREFNLWGCIWKSKIKKQRPAVKFRRGVMTYNTYKFRSKRK